MSNNPPQRVHYGTDYIESEAFLAACNGDIQTLVFLLSPMSTVALKNMMEACRVLSSCCCSELNHASRQAEETP